ncbi:sulfite exporter TauE/SafE family protein [Mongoliimonas terrestris]|uniref:sulfite exporter TauE/SafE family protein n=1 Tax=Mongoliimonas terrestris TaxID=1709001 RepID=UPI0009496FE3|nr:sulfite exporter TauE/SafE family protein [Mongoliimonas terrestris]
MESTHLLIFLAGVLAQLVDGALGMAFGVTATTVLLSFGVAPAAASTMVHVAEMFTTAASGASHIAHRNVDWSMLKRLAVPGMVGGVLGSTLLANVDGNMIRPFVSAYMLVIGAIILAKALRWRPRTTNLRWAPGLGLVGGFLDAVGGGGWGPIVTSTLIGHGGAPRRVIGTVNTTEFLVTTATSAALVTQVGLSDAWPVVFLVLGGLIAAPFAGWITKVMPERVLMSLVGGLVVLLATIQLIQVVSR